MDERTIGRNRVSGDFKYLALYWALGFKPNQEGLFVKDYGDCRIIIDAEKGFAVFESPLTLVGSESFPLDKHDSFVVLECVDRLLELGYQSSEIVIDPNNEWDVYLGNIYIKCYEWGDEMIGDHIPAPRKDTYISVKYQSRLYSGFIDRKQLIDAGDGCLMDYGVMDCRRGHLQLKKLETRCENGFVIKGTEAIAYKGDSKVVIVPEGVTSIASCMFWDNQIIEEVVLPDSLIRIGGDLFYNCKNLRKVNIPASVKEMGDNPFAGCPKLALTCESSFFRWDGHLLSQGSRLIHCQIKDAPNVIVVAEGIETIGKHVFYLCDTIESITLPKSLKRMQNFPFSGCSVKNLTFLSDSYINKQGIVYTGDMKEVVGCLNSTVLSVLDIPEGVEKIDRNSFYRCSGIGKVILPSSLTSIGYNPFNGCSNIQFESKSAHFQVIDGRLYNADASKLICCPKSKAIGEVRLPDSVIELERSAFSGCSEMTAIVLKNIGKIGKSCFSGCSSLENVYVPDYVSYIGEWAFSHCLSLKSISVGSDTFIDRNCFSGTQCSVNIREARSNYLIESENLYFLKGTKSSLRGKVDSIIIDPPYNSKIDYIGYQDDFGDSYISFIEKRLAAAKPLLKQDGWMVIFIDRGGLKAVKKAAISVFGKKLVSVRLWKKLDRRFDQNKEHKLGKKKVIFEYVLFCRNSSQSRLRAIINPKGKRRTIPWIFSGYGTTSSAKDEIAEVFGSRAAFSTPKPIALIREIIRATTSKKGIVMDFFAGSGTLGVATMELNSQDSGDRSYILITNGESNYAEKIAEARLERYEAGGNQKHIFIK